MIFRLFVTAAALAATFSMAGCARGTGDEPSTGDKPATSAASPSAKPSVQTIKDGVKVLIAGEGEGAGMDASVTGALIRVGGCLGIRVERSEYPVVWPAGTTVGSDGRTVLLGDGQFVLGDTVTGSGGFLTGALPVFAPAVPTECAPADGEIVLLGSAKLVP